MTLHMDGARISNAAAHLGVKFHEFTTDAGVDVLSFGGTKNGLMFGEAVVVLNRAASEGLTYLRKLNMQLASKMRFVSAQLIAILTDDLYLRSAGHANAMATRLRKAVEGLPGLTITQKTQSNAVFAILPPASPTGFARASGSTTGTRRGARCAGCAPLTRPRPTSIRSLRRCARNSRRVVSSVRAEAIWRWSEHHN